MFLGKPSIMSISTVSTIEELQAIFADYCNGPRTTEASEVRKVRAELLTAKETTILSSYVVNHVAFAFVDFNVPGMIDTMIGLREATAEDSIFAVYGGKSYTADRNANNRNKSESRVGNASKEGSYVNLMVRGLFATIPTDPLTVNWEGQGVSLQHRCDAMKRAKLANPDLVLPLILCSFGMPPQLRDWTDKAKGRTSKDDNVCDDSLMPSDWIQLVNLHVAGLTTEPSNRKKERAECLAVQSKVLETVNRRFNGQDIYPTGGKMTTIDELETLAKFDIVTVDKFTSETIEMEECNMNALSYLVAKVVASARGQSGKIDSIWAKNYFSPAVVASAIVLASNDEKFIDEQLESQLNFTPEMSIEEKAEHRLQVKAELLSPSTAIRIDFDLAENVLTLLQQSTDKEGGGPLGNLLAKLAEQKKKKYDADGRKYDYKPQSVASMSSMVQLIKNIQSDDFESSINTVYVRRNDTYSPAYRCFGGRDVGFINRSKKGE